MDQEGLKRIKKGPNFTNGLFLRLLQPGIYISLMVEYVSEVLNRA